MNAAMHGAHHGARRQKRDSNGKYYFDGIGRHGTDMCTGKYDSEDSKQT